jgi:hypothetical protein
MKKLLLMIMVLIFSQLTFANEDNCQSYDENGECITSTTETSADMDGEIDSATEDESYEEGSSEESSM